MNILLARDLSVELDETNYISQWSNSKLIHLKNISKVNILIGANNTGKSRFSRGLLKKEYQIILDNERVHAIYNLVKLFQQLKSNIDETFKIKISFYRNSKYPELKKEMDLIFENISTSDNALKTYFFNLAFINSSEKFFSEILITLDKSNVTNYQNKIYEILGLIRIFIGIIDNFSPYKEMRNFKSIPIEVNGIGISNIKDLVLEKLKQIEEFCFYLSYRRVEILRPNKIYIPTLRGAKTLNYISQSPQPNTILYEETIISHYFKESKGQKFEEVFPNIEIFTGLDFYDQVKTARNSKRKIRESFEEFESFLKDNFFDGKEVDIVALENSNRYLSFYIDGEDRDIHELGDGIQALIILMFPIFTAKEESWIFIDEPEINLHPGLQRLFLDQILNNQEIVKKKLKFFITTHSNHFLDLIIPHKEVSIFSFSKLIGQTAKEHKLLVRNTKQGDNDLLIELGVNNSSVFLANCSIWVEGVTDRIYISSFLKAYLKNLKKTGLLKEDVDYTFFEYAGSNLSHYLFSKEYDRNSNIEISKQINAFALSNRIYLLADQDGPSKIKKHKFLKNIAKKTNNMIYRTTEVVEIENLLDFEILKRILIDVLGQDQNIINGIIDIKSSDYKSTPIGGFINKRIGTRKKISLPLISDNKKTLNSRYKLKFANYLSKKVDSGEIDWEMISKNRYAKKITIEIYNFILKYRNK